jgi:hypothetical protein
MKSGSILQGYRKKRDLFEDFAANFPHLFFREGDDDAYAPRLYRWRLIREREGGKTVLGFGGGGEMDIQPGELGHLDH